MAVKTKIAMYEPNSTRPGKYFSLRLHNELHNEPSEYGKSDRIMVVSDIEGNFQAFYRILVKAKVINSHYNWTFGDGHLVVVGDCFDRGEQVTECLWLIYCMEEKARKEGGYVHFILGNHEIMNLNGDWRYVHPKYAEKKETSKTPSTALYDGNNELWRWLRTKNIIERIGDILFVHGGLASEFVQLQLSVPEINRLARPYYTRARESFDDPFLSIIYNNGNSPFWYRGYYDGSATENDVDMALEHFKVNTIITGHTIADQIRSHFNGKVINVNTDHAAGSSEALYIKRGKFYRVTAEGKKKKIDGSLSQS